MIDCVCHRVSDRDIAHAVQHGCAWVIQLQHELRVAAGCSTCDDCARDTFEAHRNQMIAAPRRWNAPLAVMSA